MENLPEDQKVVDLLAKLKKTNGMYPSDLLEARRQTYLRQVANIGLGIGIGAGLKQTLKGGSGAGGTTSIVTSKVLETVLIAAIAIEAGTVAYLYREKIAEAIRSVMGGPTAQEVTSTVDEPGSSDLTLEAVTTPLVVSTLETPFGTPSGIPSTAVAGESNLNDNNTNNGGVNGEVNVNATPKPGGNQGNQYGLTPKPERTKENSGSGGLKNDTGGGGGGGNSGGGGGNSGGGGGGGNSGGGGGGGNKKP